MGRRAWVINIQSEEDANSLRNWAQNVEKDQDADWWLRVIGTLTVDGEQKVYVNSDGSGLMSHLRDYGFRGEFICLDDLDKKVYAYWNKVGVMLPHEIQFIPRDEANASKENSHIKLKHIEFKPEGLIKAQKWLEELMRAGFTNDLGLEDFCSGLLHFARGAIEDQCEKGFPELPIKTFSSETVPLLNLGADDLIVELVGFKLIEVDNLKLTSSGLKKIKAVYAKFPETMAGDLENFINANLEMIKNELTISLGLDEPATPIRCIGTIIKEKDIVYRAKQA